MDKLQSSNLCCDSKLDIDENILSDLNDHCHTVTAELNDVIQKVSLTLNEISAITVTNVQTCATGIEDLEKAIDLSIKSMYLLIASSEELDNKMNSVHRIADKVRKIKTVLSALEENLL